MTKFVLDPQLENDCYQVADLSLSRLLLMNDAQYPWLILVPKIADVQEVYHLTADDQQRLWTEVADISKLLNKLFSPTKINIGALGNIVRQLHVHVIARFESDKAWPGPVWGAHPAEPYANDSHQELIEKLQQALA